MAFDDLIGLSRHKKRYGVCRFDLTFTTIKVRKRFVSALNSMPSVIAKARCKAISKLECFLINEFQKGFRMGRVSSYCLWIIVLGWASCAITYTLWIYSLDVSYSVSLHLSCLLQWSWEMMNGTQFMLLGYFHRWKHKIKMLVWHHFTPC